MGTALASALMTLAYLGAFRKDSIAALKRSLGFEMHEVPNAGENFRPRIFHLRRQSLRQLGVVAHLGTQRFQRERTAGRVVVVGAHQKQSRLRQQRNLVHHRLAVEH
jgi:hypothetical protein